MRLILLLLCIWACWGQLHAADLPQQTQEPPETEEEAHWRRYFGPVTEAEKEVFPDWRAERREQYKDIVGHEAVAAAEVIMSGDLEWYSRPMREKAARKREEDAAKLPKPEPPSPHTPEAQVVIAKIKAAYAQLDNYHEKVRIWEFSHGWDSNPGANTNVYENGYLTKKTVWVNQEIYEGELWYSRALGTRAHVERNQQWSKGESNIWMENGCVSTLSKGLVRRDVEEFWLDTACDSTSVFATGLARYHAAIGGNGVAAPLILAGHMSFPPEQYACRILEHDALWCLYPNNAGRHVEVIFAYDHATYVINRIRWEDDHNRRLADYSLADTHGEISSDSLRYEVPVEATVWLAERQAEIDAYHEQEAEESRKRLARASRTGGAPARVSIPDFIAFPIAVARQIGWDQDSKAFARQCSQTAVAEIATWRSVRDKKDRRTGKPWSQIFEECRIEMTPPIVYQTPPVFAPCPDWIKTCEEQLP